MQRTIITDAKNNLSALIDSVRRGETVLICDRNRPVARLQPVGPGDEAAADSPWLASLVRDGLVAPKPVKPARPTSIVDALRALASGWNEILPAEMVREAACRLLRVHSLRAAEVVVDLVT